MRVSGTPRNIALDGLSFTLAGDTNVTLMTSAFENEGVPTSGATMLKKTIRTPNAESVTIIAEPTEQDTIRQFSERLQPFPISLTLADGSVYRTTGSIHMESIETEENRVTIVIIPDRSIDAWQLFSA